MELLQGILFGFVLSLLFSFGPTFLSELQTCINYGFRRSFPFAFGINLGDIIIVGSLLTVLQNTDMTALMHNPVVASVGGAAICLFGVLNFRASRKAKSADTSADTSVAIPSRFKVYMRGLGINLLNPMIWLYWMSVIAVLSGTLEIPTDQMYLFFAGTLITTLSLDVVKCKLASLLQRVISGRVLVGINHAVGTLLIGFGIYLVASMVAYQRHPHTEADHTNNATSSVIEKIVRK